MAPSHSRLFISLVLGGFIALLAWALKIVHGLSPLTHALPIFMAGAGYVLLDAWRNADGRKKMAPILQYVLIILAGFVLFGWLFSANGSIQPLAVILSISLLAPAIFDLVADRTTFEKEKEDDDGPSSAYGARYPGADLGRIVPPTQ